MVKQSEHYRKTGGWEFMSFPGGIPADGKLNGRAASSLCWLPRPPKRTMISFSANFGGETAYCIRWQLRKAPYICGLSNDFCRHPLPHYGVELPRQFAPSGFRESWSLRPAVSPGHPTCGPVEIPTVVGFSGCPGGSPTDTVPNWITYGGHGAGPPDGGMSASFLIGQRPPSSHGIMECIRLRWRCTRILWSTIHEH